MSRCKKCGYNIPEGKTICPACGADMSVMNRSDGATYKRSAPAPKPQEPAPNPMLKYFDYMDNETLFNFGVNSRNGIGVAKDPDAAFKAFTVLANRGYADGMYKLAELYEEMTPPDMDKAVMWLNVAAGDGHGPSRIKLRNMVAMGVIDKSAVTYTTRPIGGAGGSSSGGEGGASVYERCIGGVLELSHFAGEASGYIITEDGYAITNTHAVTCGDEPVKRLKAKVCGVTVGATVVALGDDKGGSGRGVDLALIKLDSMPQGSVPLGFADYDKVHTGDTIFVIGNSLGYGTCITSGIISDKDRMINGKARVMYDCPTNGGNSGGPVVTSEGLVLATHVAGQPNGNGGKAQGMNYGIPEPDVLNFLQLCSRGLEIQKASSKAPYGESIKF